MGEKGSIQLTSLVAEKKRGVGEKGSMQKFAQQEHMKGLQGKRKKRNGRKNVQRKVGHKEEGQKTKIWSTGINL